MVHADVPAGHVWTDGNDPSESTVSTDPCWPTCVATGKMAWLPLQFPQGKGDHLFGLDGTETFDITGITDPDDGPHLEDPAVPAALAGERPGLS